MHSTSPTPADHLDTTDRPVWPAMRRAMRGTCPACGEGKLFRSYLKVNDHCPHCQSALHHQRADDGPAYLVILVVGHIIVPLVALFYARLDPNPWVMAAGATLGATLLALALLPVVKGGFVGFQWAKRMHGFAEGTPS